MKIRLSVSLLLFLSVCAQAQPVPPSNLEQSIAHFEQARQQIRDGHAEQTDLLSLRYARDLEELRQNAQSRGDLEGVLLMLEDQRRARAGEALAPLPENAPLSLTQARQRLLEAQNQIKSATQTRERALLQQYRQHLLELQRHLTMQNEIEAALEVRAESQRREAEYAQIQPLPDDVSPSTAAPGPPVGIRWNRGMRPGTVEALTGGAVTSVPLQIGDDNRQGARGLELRGGISELDGMQKELLDGFRSQNEFTLVVFYHTDTGDQRGPARIISFSRDHLNRNFTLGQEGDRLVMRLRTPDTGPNGSNPTLDLGPIRPNAVNRLVFTYRPGEPRAYRDGQEIELDAIRGDFSNWEEAFLLFGNEKTGDRPWRGRLESFQLLNRVMRPDAALRLSSGQTP